MGSARLEKAHGADLILGHHPHVVQTPECVEGKPVFFSLGNHVFDQKYPETKEGLIADCRLRGGRLRGQGIRTPTEPATSIPTIVGSDRAADTALAACTPRIQGDLVVDGYSIRPEPWRDDQPSEGLVLSGWSEGKRAWRSRRQRVLSVQGAPLAGPKTTPLLFTLERHPSPLDREDGVRPYVYAVGPHGLIAKWRGSALAWPLLDAVVDNEGDVCALHRGDSFLAPDPDTKSKRIAAYRWNGFGFEGVGTPDATSRCADVLTRSSHHGFGRAGL